MSWDEIGSALNSQIKSPGFKPLNEQISDYAAHMLTHMPHILRTDILFYTTTGAVQAVTPPAGATVMHVTACGGGGGGSSGGGEVPAPWTLFGGAWILVGLLLHGISHAKPVLVVKRL